jgi:hypothetical protein
MKKIINFLRKEWFYHKYWIVFIILLIIIFGYYAKWKLSKPPEYIKVPEIKEVIKYKIKKVEVPIESGKVVVLDKKELVKHVESLPEGFEADPKKQATSTADLPPSNAGHDVLNIIDTETGVSEIFAKEHELPFFAFENKGEMGVRAGISDAGREVDVYVQKNVIRMGSFHLGGYAEGSYRPDHDKPAGWKAMAVLSRPW